MPGPEWFDKPGTWLGFDRDTILEALEIELPPTHEERKERCELMGMVFCNCKLDNGHVVVYNPACPVHNHLAKLSR